MLPRILLDTADLPGGGQLRLVRRGGEFAILLGATELMTSRSNGSEAALATVGCAHLAGVADARVLIGGLGMGFTLRAALAALRPEARVTVAELVPAVIGWARGPLGELYAGSLDDPRVEIFAGDVAATIRGGAARYDAILLDVDNGPEGLSQAANDWLYQPAGLGAARAALRVGGRLAVWSSAPDARFTRRLHDAGFAVEEQVVRAHGGRGGRHVIWRAQS